MASLDSALIYAVKRRPMIYNKSDQNHCNRELIANTWTEIASEIGSDAATSKTRWTHMRDYFVKKYKESRRTDLRTKSKRKWYYFDHMAFLVPHISMGENWETLDGVNSNGILDSFNPFASPLTKYDSTDESEMTIPSPAGLQTNQTSKQEVLLGSKRMFEEVEEDEIAAFAPSVTVNPHIDINPRVEQEESYQNHINRRRNDVDGSSMEAKSDSARMKVLNKPSEDYHELFFKSLIPMVSRLDDVETVEFRAEVLGILLKYLKRQQQSSQLQDSAS